ncbi:MAG: YggS family pyridoxal phosphate-dependent enzyme [Planctomycetota bacterium]
MFRYRNNLMKEILSRNLARAKELICRAAERSGRDPSAITLVAVTKTQGTETIKVLGELGHKDIGENRVQEGTEKAVQLAGYNFRYHLIGHLQTNKVKKALAMFEIIHSLDSVRLAEAIEKEARVLGRRIKTLIEVNVSGEEAKQGIKPRDLLSFYQAVEGLRSDRSNIVVAGLMTMTPLIKPGGSAEESRPYFKKMKHLFEELKTQAPEQRRAELKYLSMGTSQDYETAVEEGATVLRIGTVLFEGL